MLRYVALIGLLLVLALARKPDHTLLWNAIYEAGHVPLFAAIALLLRGAIAAHRPRWPAWRTVFAALAVAMALGAVTELAQAPVPHRDASWIDLARNGAGATAALLFWKAWRLRRGAPLRRAGSVVAATVAVALLAASLFDVGDALGVMAHRAWAMPTVMAFDGSHWERRLLRLGRNRLTPVGRADGAPPGMARLHLRPSLYSGLRTDEPYPDWRRYGSLVFEVASDLDHPIPLAIRIHDARHDNRYRDRFNRVLTVAPGRQTVRIPLDEVRQAPDRREMDLGHIRGIVFFVHRLQEPEHLYIGPIRLE